MNATELMIGDYLQYNGMPYRVIQVTVLSFGGVFMLENGVEDCGEPIPLTKEILIKNGFTHYEAGVFNDSFYFFAKDGEREGSLIRVWLYDKPIGGVKILTKIETESTKGVGVNEVHNCDIEFVHELQHALRLCRIDKEIEL